MKHKRFLHDRNGMRDSALLSVLIIGLSIVNRWTRCIAEKERRCDNGVSALVA